MVVYFSGTGNSRWCAQLLAKRLGDELLDAAQYIRNGIAADLRSGTPWVFVSPTYAWQLPRVFRDFIRSGTFAGDDRAYFIMTCGDGIGNAEKTNQALCAEKEMRYRGTLEVLMPENYIAMFKVPGEEESARLIEAAGPVVKAGAEDILKDRMLPDHPVTGLDRFKSGPVNRCFYPLIVKDRKFRVSDSCVGCGKCAENCPTNNITMEQGRPVWNHQCTHCMACICGCPAQAIEYGRASRGKPRYQCPPYEKTEQRRL